MKKQLLFLIAIILFSCKPSQKTTVVETIEKKFDMENLTKKLENCSEKSICTFELIPNKTIEFKKDKFGIGYPIINEGNKIILKYTFSKTNEKGLQDGSYTEIVYAELDSIENITLKDTELKNVKLYFGRLCYCKGETGYFPIKNGTFSIAQLSENEFDFDVNFKVSEVPQIISNFNTTISLK